MLGVRREVGSAIAVVLAMGTIVTLMVFTWVTFSIHRTRKTFAKEDELHARYAAESVISKSVFELLSSGGADTLVDTLNSLVVFDSTVVPDPYSYADSACGSSATASVDDQGTFLRITANGKARNASCEIEAVFGREMSDSFRDALILSSPIPLEVDGRINGDVRLPVQPRGVINGIFHKLKQLPPVDHRKFLTTMKKFEEIISFPDSSEIVFQGSKAFDRNNPLPLVSKEEVFVDGHVLLDNELWSDVFLVRGPGILVSTGDVQVSGNTKLEDLEILALGKVKCFDNAKLRNVTIYSQSTIYLGDQVRFSGSIYGYESIVVANQAVVEMPTVAFTKGLKLEKTRKYTGLCLGQEARFNGTLFCRRGQSMCKIEENAIFTGLVYTMGHLVLEGTVNGCVVAQSLQDEFEPGKNKLAGGVINRHVLPAGFALPNAFGTAEGNYKLVAWVER